MKQAQRVLAVLAATVMMAGVAASPTLAWTDRLEGKPENLETGSDLGYYFWHDEQGLHLRTTGPGERHVFRATVQTNGEITGVQLVRLEGDDGFVVHAGGHRMDLRFETWDGIDGVDFRIVGGSDLRLVLYRDGELVPTEEIFLGAEGAHPANNPVHERR